MSLIIPLSLSVGIVKLTLDELEKQHNHGGNDNKEDNDTSTSEQTDTTQSENNTSASLLQSGKTAAALSEKGNLISEDSKKRFLAMTLFDIVAEQTNLDFPLCNECSDLLLEELESQLAETEQERAVYSQYLLELDSLSFQSASEEDFAIETKKAMEEEAKLVEQLQSVESERDALNQEILNLKEEQAELEEIENQYWSDYNDFQMRLNQSQEDRDCVRSRIEAASLQLEKLRRTNIYNDTFHIWHEGHFGTINGFRLGRLPSVSVDWNEINAAWGQAVLLLHTMSNHCGYSFKEYRLIPMGSMSKMAKHNDDKSTLELYGSDSLGISKFLWSRRYDNAMATYLSLVDEFGTYANQQDSSFKLPYPIEEDKIMKLSIKLANTNDEGWTKALKYMLTDLKWLLAWMASRS
eukprot:TRINITY_DN1380_c0_g1_i2.p1 TRINITY_DN1380_c0_g1~~TRINITY_DN1380_c0_g1_i2.p1  ORF type:complete len:461 (+),score=134.33 TRINITY_DN1380_c0_g1_i2:157-1383(+)